MNEKEHFKRLNKYYEKSKLGYDIVLWGAKHFGFYPDGKNIIEKEAQVLMQELIAKNLKLTSNDLVLDAGSGRGVVSVYLAEKYGCKIKGVEVVPFEVIVAKKRAEKHGTGDKTSYFLMDYSKLNFKNDFFDCIYTMETLSHSIDIMITLKEFHRVLKKGGRIALFEYSIAQDKEFSESEMEILNKVARGSAMEGLKYFRHDKFQNIFSKAGFKNVKVEDISQNVRPSLARLRKFMIIPYTLFVKPFGLQEKFPNASGAVEFYKMAKKGLIRYNIFIANK